MNATQMDCPESRQSKHPIPITEVCDIPREQAVQITDLAQNSGQDPGGTGLTICHFYFIRNFRQQSHSWA